MAALKPTTCKEAIARWEKAKGESASEAKVVELQFQWPPIEKMDGALSTLVACEKLSLSTNMIDKIAGIAGMRSLKILSLGRNYIKSLAGVETVADTLEELWLSYNQIDKLKGVGNLKNLRVLYMSNNSIKEWVEFNRLQGIQNPAEFHFITIDKSVRKLHHSNHSSRAYLLSRFCHYFFPTILGRDSVTAYYDMDLKKIMKQDCPALRDVVFIGNPICENQPDVETWRTQATNRLQHITKLDGIPILRDEA